MGNYWLSDIGYQKRLLAALAHDANLDSNLLTEQDIPDDLVDEPAADDDV